MKKVLGVLSILALCSCGGSSTPEVHTTDSATVKADTTSPKVDSVETSAPLKEGHTEEGVK